jgi:hypothetical protein
VEDYKMSKNLIKWKVNSQMMPASPEERVKLLQSMNEAIKAMIDSGEIMDFGEYYDGSGGYVIGKGDDADLYVNLIKWWPYLDCDAKPVLTIDQVIESTNKAVTEMKGK